MNITWFYTTTLGIIVSIATGIGAVITIIRGVAFLRKWFSGRIKHMIGYRNIIERQAVLEGKIDRILGELTHNGGSSTKDVVKSVQESVIRLEGRQQAMLDTMSNDQGMFECTLFGDFLWTNRQLCYMLGRTKEDLLGKGWVGCISLPFRDTVLDEWDMCLDQQREFNYKFEMNRYLGGTIMVEMNTTKITDYAGNEIGFFGTITHLNDE